MKPIRPEDILPDGKDFVEIDNQPLRKGSVAAVLTNATILQDPMTTQDEKRQALETIKSLIPTLNALGMHRHVIWKNPLIQNLIEETTR